MYLSLEAQGHQVVPVDASLNKLDRAFAAAASFSRDRAKWRSKFRYGAASARRRTAAATRSAKKAPMDVILQIGASFDPPMAGKVPYAIYSDWNMALDGVESRSNNGKSRGLTTSDIDRIGKDHARRYREASMIFTISERLRQSFMTLYGIPPHKVMTAYAGPNFDVSMIDDALAQPKPKLPPTLLFIAKEFKRKGGDLVAAAFRKVQEYNEEAQLLFAGSEKLPDELAGLKNVQHLGLLDKGNPLQLRRLLQAYRSADMLLLPSRHDPFPTVIREAMFFGLPCIASDIWAMSEMIVNNETGILIPEGNSEELSEAIFRLIYNDELRAKMGAAARRLAVEKFSWDAVGKVLHSGIMEIKR
jgi:glycosyltransferase involved in cell wall biosynthesis